MSPLSGEVIEALGRTLAIAAAVALLAGAWGLLMAWLVTRTDLPGGRRLANLLALPYAIPAYLLGMAWIVLGNPTVGLLRAWLPSSGTYGFWGIVFVESSVALAFPYLELRSGFDRLDPALEEAARMSGAGPGRVFRDVSLPLLRPALLSGMLLAFLYAMASFGVPALLGLPVRQGTLTTLIYAQFRMGGEAGLRGGFRLSLLLLAIAAVLIGLARALRGARPPALAGGKVSRPSRVRLGAGRWPAAAVAWGGFGVSVLLPWGALLLSALAPVAGDFDPARWTLRNLEAVLTSPDFREALVNSLLLAGTLAAAVVGLGFGLGYLAERRRGPASKAARAAIEALGLPFSAPGSALAMGVLFAAGVIHRLGVPVRQPLLLLGAAYFLKYAAVGARSLATAFAQVDPVMEEAARLSGASTRELLWDIWRPLLGGALGAAGLLAFLPMLTELTMSLLLTGPGAATLGTLLFELQDYADQPQAAALAWMLLTVALGVGLLATASFKGKRND